MKNFVFILACFGLLFMYSCTPPMYIPNTTNVPTLIKKGDTETNISIGSNGTDLQAAHALTDNVGVMLNASYENRTSDSTKSYTKHLFVEGAVGYSVLLNKSSANVEKTRFIFSGYGGLGIGSASGIVQFSNIFNTSINYTNEIKGNYFRVFLQPSIGVNSKYVDFFFTLRTSYVNVYDLYTDMEADWQNSYISDDDYNTFLTYFERKKYNLFYEPTMTLKIGGEQLKFFNQMGLSLGQIPNVQTTFRQRPLIFIIGLQFRFNTPKSGFTQSPSQ